jgi:hypothetical protein
LQSNWEWLTSLKNNDLLNQSTPSGDRLLSVDIVGLGINHLFSTPYKKEQYRQRYRYTCLPVRLGIHFPEGQHYREARSKHIPVFTSEPVHRYSFANLLLELPLVELRCIHSNHLISKSDRLHAAECRGLFSSIPNT